MCVYVSLYISFLMLVLVVGLTMLVHHRSFTLPMFLSFSLSLVCTFSVLV